MSDRPYELGRPASGMLLVIVHANDNNDRLPYETFLSLIGNCN